MKQTTPLETIQKIDIFFNNKLLNFTSLNEVSFLCQNQFIEYDKIVFNEDFMFVFNTEKDSLPDILQKILELDKDINIKNWIFVDLNKDIDIELKELDKKYFKKSKFDVKNLFKNFITKSDSQETITKIRKKIEQQKYYGFSKIKLGKNTFYMYLKRQYSRKNQGQIKYQLKTFFETVLIKNGFKINLEAINKLAENKIDKVEDIQKYIDIELPDLINIYIYCIIKESDYREITENQLMLGDLIVKLKEENNINLLPFDEMRLNY